jgi:hypothetical protein
MKVAIIPLLSAFKHKIVRRRRLYVYLKCFSYLQYIFMLEEENSNGLGIKQARFKKHVETKRDSNNVKNTWRLMSYP